MLELVAHDAADDVSRDAPSTGSTAGVSLVERHGFLVARGEGAATVPEDAFDHRPDREARAESLWGRP